MAESGAPRTPAWLTALGVFSLVALAAAAAYAVAIGVANFPRIGV
jgi:hypothetical protein